MNAKEISLARAKELSNSINDFMAFKEKALHKMAGNRKEYKNTKAKLLDYYNADESNWNDWHWQMKHRITDVETLVNFIHLSQNEVQNVKKLSKTNRFAIVPYYLALITTEQNDPIKMLSVPSKGEYAVDLGKDDPMAEEFTNPAGSITRRYPDRLIINVTNICAMYCRHCQRRRLIGETDGHTSQSLIDESIAYIKQTPEIRDVLITGGDAFLLSDHQIENLLKALRQIDHVEIIRFGTRTPVTMPMRITDNLTNILKRYHPVFVNTQYNHYHELTKESMYASQKLADAGIVVGNQAVLLKGVNDDKYVMTLLNQRLLQARVRPYYIFHAKEVKGTHHFMPTIAKGLEIMSYLRGHTSGLAIPTYIFNAPGGLGKIPLLPQYIISHEDSTYRIKTWEGKIIEYTEK
ncbi:MAG: KamA family radical SAM protein [Candidatus Izimaplasma sp.]|nr:KamA family radical SAM protein [Candidatus Izimaplasma bacterium]